MNWDDIFIYVPFSDQIVRIAEGSGDNLSDEDVAEGYCDYIYYEQYALSDGLPEVDGGIILQIEYLRHMFASIEECISKVLDAAYGDITLDYILLERKEGDDGDRSGKETE